MVVALIGLSVGDMNMDPDRKGLDLASTCEAPSKSCDRMTDGNERTRSKGGAKRAIREGGSTGRRDWIIGRIKTAKRVVKACASAE